MSRRKTEDAISAEITLRIKTCDLITEEALEINYNGDFNELIQELVSNRGIFDFIEGDPRVVSIKKLIRKI